MHCFRPKNHPEKYLKIRTKTHLRLGFPGRFISVFAERVPAKTVRKVQKKEVVKIASENILLKF